MNNHDPAEAVYRQGFRDGLAPDPDWLISWWANERRILPDGVSKESGPYRWERTPYLREIMDCLSPHFPVNEVCFMKAVQIGGTTVGENFLLYVIDAAPGPAMMVMPTMDLAKEHSKDRIAHSISAIPTLRDKVKEIKSRDSGNTILSKQFPGGYLKMTGSNSAKAARSKSIRYLILDDVDGFDADIGGEGDPCALFRKRTSTWGTKRKIFENSTPTIKHLSRIERSYLDSDQRKYEVPCPHCRTRQELVFGGKEASFGLKFTHDGTVCTDVWYECKECGGRIDEHHKDYMLAHGEWVPRNPSNTRRRGYQISALYSPLGWFSWRQIVEEFLSAGKNPELLKVFVNTILAETWEEAGSKPKWEELKARAETYSVMTVPPGGLFLTMGVDTQDDRIEFEIWAWGRDEEAWLIAWGPIYGDPSETYVWDELDRLRSMPVRHAYGVDLTVSMTAVDAMGHKTQEVYNYVRKRSASVMAVQGQRGNRPALGKPSPQDVNHKGKIIKGGVLLWPIGGNLIKQTIYDRLAVTKPGPRMIHFPQGLDDEFYIQLTAEQKVTTYQKGFPVQVWVKEPGKRNEALDCAVYAYGAAIRAGLLRMNWDELERMISPRKMEGPGETAAGKPARPRVVYRSKLLEER